MSRVRLSLLLIAFLGLITCQSSIKATTGHSITNLFVKTSPATPTVGKAVDTLTIKFDLTAQSGIDVNRIKIFFGNGTSAFPTSPGDFTSNPNINHPDTRTAITYKTEEVTFSQTTTKIKVIYCVTSSNCTSPLATASINKISSSSSSGNSGSGSSGGGTTNGHTSNGSTVTQAPHVFYLDVDEITNGDTGIVSLEPKQFRLTVEHDKNYLDTVTDENFNPDTNPILSNLVITSTNIYTGEKTKVTDDYIFDLETASITSTNRAGYLITEYISNSKIIKNGQKLKFNINLATKYFDKFDIKTPNGAVLRDSATINIEPLTGTMSSIEIDPSSISFSNTGKSHGKSNYSSETVNISADLNSDDAASTVSDVEFFRLNASKNKIKSKLSINSKKVLNISPSLTSSNGGSISNNGSSSSITLPVTLATAGKEKTIIKQGFNDPSKAKTLKIPMTITTNTVNGLDLIFTGTLDSTVDTHFEETGVNGSSL